jgi:quercetin dioxygenase-like cupin family protein
MHASRVTAALPRLIGALLFALLLAAPAAFGTKDAQGFVRIGPDEVKWDPPNAEGVQTALIDGDPTKPGIYVMRIKFPPGVMSHNHFHAEDRHALVLKGTWWTGTGDEFAPDKTIALKPGSYMKHPAGAHHFDGAKDEEVILQLIGYGPTGTTVLRPGEGLFGKIK